GKARNLLDLGRYEEADQLLWHVISVWPASGLARALWANCPAAQHDWKTSNARWKIVLAQHASQPQTLKEYGRYLGALGGSHAGDFLRKDLSDNPVFRAEILIEYYLGQGAYEYAARLGRKLIERQPENLEYRLLLTRVLSSQGSKPGLRESVSIL